MKLLSELLVIFLINNIAKCEKPFKSIPVVVKSYENDTVLLPCYLDGAESKLRVRWYKDATLLEDSVDGHHYLPSRIRMHANYSLQVDMLGAQDTADYTCEVIRPEPWGPIRQTHTIEVQYSPTVRTIPEDGFLEVRKGEFVDIGCETTGTPEPIVDWRKNGEPLALLDHRSRIKFRAEHRLLAGVYECIVNNGVGDPIRAAIRVVIHDAPVVSADRTFVHTAIGLRAALIAKVVFAIPPARISWYREGRPVHTDDRIHIIAQDNVHELIFRTVRETDLGNYTFRAENKLGMADISFKLTGIPNTPSFKVDPTLNKATATTFTLVWEVDSYSTIFEHNLRLRPYTGRVNVEPDSGATVLPNLWRDIVVPGDSRDGPIHSALYVASGLTPSTVYEATVTSRNRFGWSKESPILHFATEPGVGEVKSETIDDIERTPVFEDFNREPHNISQAKIFGFIEENFPSIGTRETPSLTAILFLYVIYFVLVHN